MCRFTKPKALYINKKEKTKKQKAQKKKTKKKDSRNQSTVVATVLA